MSTSNYEQEYIGSLPNASKCGYGILQVSARRWAIVMTDGVATVLFGCSEVPRYLIVDGCENLTHPQAMDKILQLCKERELQVLRSNLKSGAKWLDTLSDKELSRLPLGPLCDAGMQGYVRKRLGKEQK